VVEYTYVSPRLSEALPLGGHVSIKRRFVAVLRASSAVRLLPGQDIGLALKDPAGPVLVVIRTRYDTVGETGQVPRELWIEISGPGDSLEAARKHLHDSATTASTSPVARKIRSRLGLLKVRGAGLHEFPPHDVDLIKPFPRNDVVPLGLARCTITDLQ
jgi:hypothetical protein